MVKDKKYVKPPVKTFVGMAVFILLLAIVPWIEWPMGPANLSWGVWILCYFSYAVLIGWSIIWAFFNKKASNETEEN
jgi:hypothetical protein